MKVRNEGRPDEVYCTILYHSSFGYQLYFQKLHWFQLFFKLLKEEFDWKKGCVGEGWMGNGWMGEGWIDEGWMGEE